MTKLNEGERLNIIAALFVTTLTAPNSKRKGSTIRLAKKLFRDLCEHPGPECRKAIAEDKIQRDRRQVNEFEV